MAKQPLKQVIRYKFDNFIVRGGMSIFLSFVVSFMIILVVLGILRGIINFSIPEDVQNPGGFFHQLYQVFLHLTDPGSMSYDIKSATAYKLVTILTGLIGIIITSTLVAFIVTALDQKLAALKKGYSKVIEDGHTLILGWNDRTVEILRELIIANKSKKKPSVVILAEEEKEAMDDFLSIHLPDKKNTCIVTRSGNRTLLANLELASIGTCKSVIILASCQEYSSDQDKLASDAKVIKTALAIMDYKPKGRKINIVAEVFDDRTREIIKDISPDEITAFDSENILAKILVQTSRSVGLSVVYSEIMSFQGCEMYFHNATWNSISFGKLQFHFPDGVPMGIRKVNGTLLINPPAETLLDDSDDILIVAEDDSTIEFKPHPVAIPRDLKLKPGKLERKVERNLIIGWTRKAKILVKQYANYVLENSSIDIMLRDPKQDIRANIRELQSDLPNIKISLIDKNPLDKKNLLEAKPFAYDTITILSQSSMKSDAETTDSETIIILLLLRKIFAEYPQKAASTKLITEVLDSKNKHIISSAGVSDLIISNQLVSMMFAQASEEAHTKLVYDSLFEEAGSEIYFKPASLYLDSFPSEVSFVDLMALAQKRSEVCLGVKIKALERDMDKNFGVKLIPQKNRKYSLTPEDTLIVLAEDET
jgi:hypothetical protein